MQLRTPQGGQNLLAWETASPQGLITHNGMIHMRNLPKSCHPPPTGWCISFLFQHRDTEAHNTRHSLALTHTGQTLRRFLRELVRGIQVPAQGTSPESAENRAQKAQGSKKLPDRWPHHWSISSVYSLLLHKQGEADLDGKG